MKSFLHSIVLVLPILGGHVLAQTLSSAPLLEPIEKTERLTLFETLKGDLVYAPVLLSSAFRCNDRDVCTLQVFNKMSEAEEQSIVKYRNAGFQTYGIKPEIYKDAMKIERESLNGEITGVQNNFMSVGNLAILDNAYASTVFKAPRGKTGIELTQQFQTTGLGAFEIEYELIGFSRDYSIRVSSTDLRSTLLPLVGKKVTFSALRDLISKSIDLFTVHGYQPDETTTLISSYVRETLMKPRGGRTLSLDSRKLDQLQQQKNRISIGESLIKAKRRCKARIEIRALAQMEQSCEVIHEAQ